MVNIRGNIVLNSIGVLARKFRSFQEVWILPYWEGAGVASIPIWALDITVLIAKLCSTCVAAIVHLFIPPVMKNLYGETILVTGAGQGVGRELALQLAAAGATVLCVERDAPRAAALLREPRARDAECFGYTVDVTKREQVTALAARIRRELMEVTMVISNASYFAYAPVTQLKHESVLKMIETNLLAHIWIIQEFLPSMIERRYGHIVAINSTAGLVPFPDMVPYCAATFGLRGMMESLTEELRLSSWTRSIRTTSVYLSSVAGGAPPAPAHRFASCLQPLSAQQAASIIIQGIRKNRKNISIPYFMKVVIMFHNMLPYRIRIVFTDFFNFGHRGWFYFC